MRQQELLYAGSFLKHTQQLGWTRIKIAAGNSVQVSCENAGTQLFEPAIPPRVFMITKLQLGVGARGQTQIPRILTSILGSLFGKSRLAKIAVFHKITVKCTAISVKIPVRNV